MRWLFAVLALPSLAWADAAAAKPAPQGPGVGDLLQMALSLVVVIGFILALTWILGRIRGAPRHASGSLSVLAEVAVGPKERVVLVKVGDSQALVGVGATGVSSLQLLAAPVKIEIAEAAGSFAEKLKGMMGR
ncbi:MAG TPA: flagellar biosynthetic protein FliO [Steroidobacteraceae bacterium]|nr:flagellar biosynthetic protein FliO [Steroidobacteraceae bacterium]